MKTVTACHRLLTLAVLALTTPGCVFWARNLEPIRREVETVAPRSHFHPGLQLHLGRLSLGLARRIVQTAAEDEEDRQVARLLSHVNGVEVALYEVEGLEPHEARRFAQELVRLGERRGWQLATRFQDEEAVGSVHFQLRGESIHSIWIFVLEEDSLVMTRLRGRLDQALADAIALHGREIPGELVEEAQG